VKYIKPKVVAKGDAQASQNATVADNSTLGASSKNISDTLYAVLAGVETEETYAAYPG